MAFEQPDLNLWTPGPPPPEPVMDWPSATDTGEQTGPRHAVDTGAGQSVLSSLGITAGGGGGGRRRAKDDVADEEPPAPRTVSFEDIGYLEPLSPDLPTPPALPEIEARAPEPQADPLASFDVRWGDTPLPAQHAPIVDPPPLELPPPAVPVEMSAFAGSDDRTEPLREPEAEPEEPAKPVVRSGRRRRSVQLADLLTEALMAYQTAQDANDARNNPIGHDPSSALPGPTSLPEPLAGSMGRDVASADRPPSPPGPAGPPNRIGDSHWVTTRWNPTTDRP